MIVKIAKKIKSLSKMTFLTEIFLQSRRKIFFGTILMLISRIAGLFLPASTKYLGDEILTKQNFVYLKWIILAIGVSVIFEAVTRFSISQALGKVAQEAVAELRKKLQQKVLRLPFLFFNSMPSGQLLSRIMNDADSIRIIVSTGLGTFLGSLLTMLIAGFVLLYLNWFLTLIILLILLIYGLVVLDSLKRIRPFFRERSMFLGEIFGRLAETLNGIRIVKAYTLEKKEADDFSKLTDNLLQNSFKSLTETSKISALTSLIVGFIGILIILLGGNSIQNGTMSLGDFMMFVAFAFLLGSPIAELATLSTQITDAVVSLERTNQILTLKTENADDFDKQSLPVIVGNIEFENISSRYEKDVPVLQNISFQCQAGETIALVGPSGSGKSTILNLLLNFIKPDGGTIKIDGKDIQTFKLADYRQHFGVVLQDNFLFDGTISDNIQISRPNAKIEEIKEVCRIANADEFIEKLPDKYETVVGERGLKLSGGQRQRIAIARALLANPRILILDEATSSLDSESEALIQEGLTRLREGRTTFVIAHRLSTIRSADRILVVESGEILERGTHDELIAMNGRYRQFYDKQYKFEQNLFVNPGEEIKDQEKLSATKL